MDPKKLRREGELLIEEALLAIDTGDVVRARELLARGQMRLEAAALLTGGEQPLTVPRMNHALSTSIGRRPGKDDKFAAAMHAKGYTLRSLAIELGVSNPLLSMSLSKVRTIKREVADRIQKIIGVPWPGDISNK